MGNFVIEDEVEKGLFFSTFGLGAYIKRRGLQYGNRGNMIIA
jgi:hypothetical protein